MQAGRDNALHNRLTIFVRVIDVYHAGSSHQWTSDGASSIYSPTSDSFRIYMFREGDTAGVPYCQGGQISTVAQPCNQYGCGQPNTLPCAHAQTGTGSGGGQALTAAGAQQDHWKITWIGVEN